MFLSFDNTSKSAVIFSVLIEYFHQETSEIYHLEVHGRLEKQAEGSRRCQKVVGAPGKFRSALEGSKYRARSRF
jgi:hypothetical protein